jgi:hypothetical protein
MLSIQYTEKTKAHAEHTVKLLQLMLSVRLSSRVTLKNFIWVHESSYSTDRPGLVRSLILWGGTETIIPVLAFIMFDAALLPSELSSPI